MKHLNKILTGAAVLVLLTGCDLFKHSITLEKYQEKVDKIQEHQYSEATVTLKEEVVGTGMYAETTKNEDTTAKFTYNKETNVWVPEDEDGLALKYYVYTIQGKKITDVISTSADSSLEVETTYYSNLDVKTVIKGSVSIEDIQMEVRYDKYQIDYKFNKYGYLTSYKLVCNASTTMGTDSGTQNNTRQVKVSYK